MSLEPAREALNRYLDPLAGAPLTVAVSGGGDSLALLALTAEWAHPCGRRLLVLHVDHGLNPASSDWGRGVEAAAARFGAGFRRLTWMGPKPATGLPAAARAARHALLAQAAREAQAAVILLGHTRDDLLETDEMRREGASAPSPRAWSPSPAWPEGRGVFLLRPLLGVSRAALRQHLRQIGEDWVEDPANADLRFARARARIALQHARSAEPAATATPTGQGAAWTAVAGALSAPRQALGEGDLAAACLCAAGSDRPPRGQRRQHLARRLAGAGQVTLTLAGARIEADEQRVLVSREAGEAARGGLPPLRLAAGETAVWDGRFLIQAEAPVEIHALRGRSRRLEAAQQTALRALPTAVRGGLPAAIEANGRVSCPILGQSPVLALPLAPWRMAAYQGRLANELQALLAAAPFLQMAKARADDYVGSIKPGGA